MRGAWGESTLYPTGARLLREHLHDWVEQQLDAGAAPADVPDLFYLERRMATWAGPSHGCVEPVKDTTSALWSRRLLAHELGASTAERSGQVGAAHQVEIDAAGGAAPLGDGPDDQRLPAAHVPGHEHVVETGLEFLVPGDVPALV